MTITKFGHSCLLVEDSEARILIDPGKWSSGFLEAGPFDAIFLTHEHPDHTYPEYLKQLLAKNPSTLLYANAGVGRVLDQEGMRYEQVADGERLKIKNVEVQAMGREHAVIYPTMPHVENTSYLIGGRFFCTGDALYDPKQSVEVLALPVCAPWLKLSDAIDYAKVLNPKMCFPVHDDGMLKELGPFHKHPERELTAVGIQWTVLENGKEMIV